MDILRSVKFPSGHTLTVWDAGTRAPTGQNQLRYEFRAPASVTADPRGPNRKIQSVDSRSDGARVALSCGHVANLNQIYTYRVGDDTRCFACVSDPRGEVLFEGEDYGVSPLHAMDSDAALLGLLAFLTLRPGDTDHNYFDRYDGAQYGWTQSQACESLACDVSIAEEAGGCACALWENLYGWTCEE